MPFPPTPTPLPPAKKKKKEEEKPLHSAQDWSGIVGMGVDILNVLIFLKPIEKVGKGQQATEKREIQMNNRIKIYAN